MPTNVTHVRSSFLTRNPNLSPEQFSRHYEHCHGPLAISLEGFLKFTAQYVQNHVLEKLTGGGLEIDGVTVTTQLPREDYSRGFFHDPDYAKVQPDEQFLFDISKTRSVLGRQVAPKRRPGSNKLLLLTSAHSGDELLSHLAADEATVTELDTTTASSLGFGSSTFGYDRMIEAWFNSAEALRTGFRRAEQDAEEPIEAWRTREVLILPSRTGEGISKAARAHPQKPE
jgi:hypothetical protein